MPKPAKTTVTLNLKWRVNVKTGKNHRNTQPKVEG